MMETVSAPVWEPDEGGALPWIGLITRSSPSRHYPLINHVMIKTFNGGLTILSFGHHHVYSMNSVHHSPLGVNVRCHLICLFFWLPMFLLLWEITNLPLTSLLSMVLEHPPFLPWWYRWGAVDHLSSRLISDHPHHHLVPGAVQSECEGHSDQRGSTLVSPPSPSPLLFLLSTFPSEKAYS